MSVEESEFMLVGWILFLLTLQIAIWRDVVRQNLAAKRADEDLEYLLKRLEQVNDSTQEVRVTLKNVKREADRCTK
jgi:hypothetical protein